MDEKKRGRGRPAGLTQEARKEQLRLGKAAQRERETEAGRTRIDAAVSVEAKANLEAYRDANGFKSLGVALDAILLKIYVDRST
ncbi:hypothetical protein ACFFU8_09325 [Chromobacterium piscinae]|uniref:hypothetical protein n=1 Tax=Chromobacterium piscinae TaxID=686831 RepID=UPI001E2F0282|nr:hypothetical protein [Chromobacterium piscinae]MCD5327895.1 hypothetical protein [Chromobacterium piscinae]